MKVSVRAVAAKRRRKGVWVPLRWIQCNIRYTVPADAFLENLDDLDAHNPDVITLNEVGGRYKEIALWAAANGYLHVQPHRQPGMADDQAILLAVTSWRLHDWGVDKMHKEPPGPPTARYLLWTDATFIEANLAMLLEAFHSLAAVERSNHLNRIARTAYYVAGNINVVRRSRTLRSQIAQRHHRTNVPVVLAGDLNWHWTVKSWINRSLIGTYFTCVHTVLPVVKTLGRRAVDIVAKRGGRVRFVRSFSFHVRSDHRALVVDMLVQAV